MNNDWINVGKNGEKNEGAQEYTARTSEDRLGRMGKKKNKKAKYILTLFAYLLVLIAIMYVGAGFYTWINGEIEASQQETEEVVNMLQKEEYQESYTYTEMMEKIQAVEAQADARVEQAAKDKEKEILEGIKDNFTAGDTTVEALRPFYPDELVLASSGQIHFVPINTEMQMNTLKQENLQILESGEYQYVENGQVISHKGIDVSKHQGNIDWDRVAADGVEFAFIRVGLRGYGTGKLVEDEYFEKNLKGASNAGIKVGVYLYTQAVTEDEILEEAELVLKKIEPYHIDGPVVIDVEKVAGAKARMNELTVEERTNLVLLFCRTIENAGYKPMIYHNMEMGVLMLDMETFENYDKWLASYSDTLYYPYEYRIWQYSDEGKVDGINGNVDLNISFSPFWEE